MADLFKLLQPLQFFDKFLKTGIRPDGRKFDEFRNVLLTCDCVSSANGSALVKLESSSVICGITTSLVKPPMGHSSNTGILDLSVKFSNTCSSDLTSPDRATISDFVRECLKKALHHANVIDMENLCLIARKFVWKLQVEIICLNLNGSIVDMAMVALLCALRRCRLRQYDVDHEFDLVTASDSYEPLKINCYPIFTTFAVINNNLLADPALNEEEMSDSMIQIAIDPDMDFDSDCILFLEVTGAKEIDEKLLTKCYTKACERGKFLRKLIEKFATDDTGQPIEFLHE